MELSDAVNWYYLLREYYLLYRTLSAGGSKPIRRHKRDVRERISQTMHPKTPVVHREPAEKPVCAYLQRALDQAPAADRGVVTTLHSLRPHLHWEYGYQRLPAHLARKYAYAECVGPRGPVVSERLILGLVLLAPGTTYPTHAHQTITESYIGLSGAFSENDVGVFGPKSLILNPPGRRHRITVDSYEPCLLAFAWTGYSRDLDDPGMCFSARTPQAL